MDGQDLTEKLLEEARRQTSALETIRGVVLFFLALSIVGCLIALAVAVSA